MITYVLMTIILIILIMVKLNLNKKINFDNEENLFFNNIKVGNAQILGKCKMQNDYFAVNNINNSLFTVIADGLTDKESGKFAAVTAVEILKYNYENNNYNNINQFFKMSFGDINKRLKEDTFNNKTGAAVLCIILKDNIVEWASVGNCTLLLFRKKEIFKINDVKKNEYEFGKLKINKKDIIFLCTDGAYKSLDETEIINVLSNKKHPYNKTIELSNIIQNKNYRHQDNATIIVIERQKRGGCNEAFE